MKKLFGFRSWPTCAALVIVLLGFGTHPAYGVWQLVWSDDFDGTNVSTANWSFETGNNNGWGNSEREYYTSRTNNAYVAGGALHIVARQESYGGFPFTSARMKTQNHFSKQYGRIEFRAKLPQGQGFWPALWMLGTNITSVGWPACGEIDVMEFNGSWSNKIQGTLHYNSSSLPTTDISQTRVYTLPTAGDSVTNFHTYAIQWTTNSIAWMVDSNIVQTWTSWSSSLGPYPAPFNRPFFIIMNVAVGGSYLGNPTDSSITNNTVFPGEMQVDYVRVYDDVAATAPPGAPTGLTTSPGNGNVYVTWTPPDSGASGYNVKRSTTSGGPYTTVGSSSANNFTDTGLANCGTYYYVVTATNVIGESTNSVEQPAALGPYALAVNSGGSAAGQFVADANFSGGTQAAPTTNPIDTSAVASPAPLAVYQSERYGNFTYTFPGLTPGVVYKIRLHFAEFYWTSVGQRVFNVFINGTQVLSNFDIIAAAGAPNEAIIKEFTATPSGGQINIQYSTVTDNAKSSGIELMIPQPAAPANLAAAPGDAQVALSWTTSGPGATYNLKSSLSSSGPFAPVASGLTSTTYTNSGLASGTTYYYAVSTVIAGCESTNSSVVSGTPVCTPPAAPVAGNNGPIYEGMSLNLTASTVPGATYSWTGPNDFAAGSQNPSIAGATTNASGLYSVTATVGSCTSTAGQTLVTILPLPQLAFQATDGSLILNWPSGTLQSATNLPGPWFDVSGATAPYTNTTSQDQEFFRVRLP